MRTGHRVGDLLGVAEVADDGHHASYVAVADVKAAHVKAAVVEQDLHEALADKPGAADDQGGRHRFLRSFLAWISSCSSSAEGGRAASGG